MTTTIDKHDDQKKHEEQLRRAQAQVFALFFRSYMEASDEVRDVIREMAAIINDTEADDDDRMSALDTLMEAMFPSSHDGALGIDLGDFREAQGESSKEEFSLHDREEELFSERLRALMTEKGMNQVDLAERIGVGQPAVAMMLKRRCRPQRRTVERIAEALGVAPQQLWPDF